jgi:hypothetical protein
MGRVDDAIVARSPGRSPKSCGPFPKLCTRFFAVPSPLQENRRRAARGGQLFPAQIARTIDRSLYGNETHRPGCDLGALSQRGGMAMKRGDTDANTIFA